MSELVVCMLPARNAVEHLTDWFDSVGRFADAVVALDDGSTDGTPEMLSSHPLVRRVLTNPPRDDYRGWDDSANRTRLLAAAAELRPRWIMQLDADERITADDGAALREFLREEADPSYAYLFRVFRMIGDLDHYDYARLWVGRLFAYEAGQRFPTDRLHFVALPTSISRSRWLKTTIRIQHLSSLTAEDRRRRVEKYRQADPDERHHPGYTTLLEGPGEVRAWYPRSPHLPVVANTAKPERAPVANGPVLSAVVIAQDDDAALERAVRSVLGQQCSEPFEVIVAPSSDRTADFVRSRCSRARVVELVAPARQGAACNAALAVARGRYVSFTGSDVELAPGTVGGWVRAHRAGWAMVSGTTLNATRTWPGWASYFLDHSAALSGRPSGPLEDVPDDCSYLRDALIEVGGFPEGPPGGEDRVVKRELWARGYGAYHSQDVMFLDHRRGRRVDQLIADHFARGRVHGRLMIDSRDRTGPYRRREIARYVVKGVPVRVALVTRRVKQWDPELRSRLRAALPLVVAGAVSEWAGACFELVRRAPAHVRVRRAEPRAPVASEPGPDLRVATVVRLEDGTTTEYAAPRH